MTDQPLEPRLEDEEQVEDEVVEEEPAAEAPAGWRSPRRLRTTPTCASPPTSTTTASASRASRSSWTSRANERLLNELLPVLDDLERALEAAAEHEEAKLEEGVRLVHRSLLGLVERHGLSEIETEGAFDPHVHEALLAQPGEGAEEGAVLQVLQKGYRLGDKVLRPARVIVAE